MLSPEAIAQLRTGAGLSATPPATPQGGSTDILAQRKAALGLDQPVEITSTKDQGSFYGGGKDSIGAKLTKDVTEGASDLSGDNGAVQQLLGPTKAVFRGLGDTAGAVFHPIGAAIDKLTGGKLNEVFNDIGQSSQIKGGLMDKVTDLPIVQKLAMEFPNMGEDLQRALNLIFLGTANVSEPSASTLVERTKPQIEAIKNAPETIINKADELGTNIKNKVQGITGGVKEKISTPTENDLQKIQEKISPKPTIKEARLATDQGRLYKGKEATTFKSGTPDKVATSDQQFKSTQTINRLIPKAADMDEPTLHVAMKEKIGEISKNLKPEMQKVPIKPETIQKMADSWEEVKTQQNSDPYTPSDVNMKAQQSNFESRLNEVNDGTMDDVWEARKAYDDSVPDRIKNADDLSSESLQTQKDMWLQNRKIFSDAINDLEDGLGDTSKSAFSDMRDLYEGQRGLMSKAKINTKIEDSTVLKAGKGILKRAIPYEIGTHL